MRVAALYDIHGNLAALDAVLAEVDADVILVGGDTVMGPLPGETLERLRSLPGDVRFIRGNADREVYEDEPGLAPHEAFEYARSRLSAEQVEFLRTFPLTVSIGRVLFCHATPRNDEEILTKISPEERWREALAGVDADVVVCGHTHVQFDRRIGDIRLVNAGSVGMPYEHEAGAYWALLDGTDVELRHTRCQAPNMSEWPGEWPQATPEEATEHFERMSRGEA
ncbi:MAG TPA: YfcE family phosphodiesterase [Gaiellaceae bacterium]|nr:YfcE family phosphodiesterase [Gaiellaceae bacterium]